MTQRISPPQRLGRLRWPVLALFTALVLLALGVPVASAVYWMTAGLPPALSGGANVSLLNAAAHTAGYGAAAGALATVLAFPVALLALRHPGRVRHFLERSTYLVLGMPGVVVAFALSYSPSATRPASATGPPPCWSPVTRSCSSRWPWSG